MWLEPVAADLPWGHVPAQLLHWHGGFIGFDWVGDDGAGETLVASSSDLAHWTVLARGKEAPFGGAGVGVLVAALDGLVAIGPGDPASPWCPQNPSLEKCIPDWQVWTSPDGASWKAEGHAPFASEPISGVAAGRSGLVVLADRGWQKQAMWYSPSGSAWQSVSLSGPAFTGAQVTGVVAVPVGFVATGGVGGHLPPGIGDPGGNPAGWWSTDGLKWTRAKVELPFDQAMYLGEVHQMANGLLAVGFRSGAWSSVDGRSWTKLPPSGLTEGVSTRFVSDGNHALALVSSSGPNGEWAPDQLFGSVDGSSWRRLSESGYDSGPLLRDVTDVGAIVVTSEGVSIFATPSDSSQALVLRGKATP